MSLFAIEQVGEMVRTTWQELFTIKFLHPGYETPIENFLNKGIQIVPDRATQKLFSDQKIRYRFFTNSLVCYIECIRVNPPAAEPKIPFIPIAGDLPIRFLILSSPSFAARTNVVAAGSGKIYQFTNKINNTGGGLVFLTAPLENHSTTTDYEMGTVVQNGGNLFTAVKTVAGADGIAIGDTNFWEPGPPAEQVVNNADLKNIVADATCFGVIDMYKLGTTNSSYRLFDTGDQLFNPAPLFTIKFASRF
jgi:hypothetical protein